VRWCYACGAPLAPSLPESGASNAVTVEIETAFRVVCGRAPTEEERRSLLRLALTWNVQGNEAVLAFLLVLELGSGFRKYPARCAEAVDRAVKRALLSNTEEVDCAGRRRAWVGQSPALWVAALLGLVIVAVTALGMGVSLRTPTASSSWEDITPPMVIAAAALAPLVWAAARRVRHQGPISPDRPRRS
jgi:hypothetical protein